MIVNKQDEEYHLNCILIHLSRFSDPENLMYTKRNIINRNETNDTHRDLLINKKSTT